MGARGCLELLLLLPPLLWGEHLDGGSGVASAGSESLAGAVADAGGDETLLQPSIIGGHEAKSHSRPYMVSLQVKGRHSCGAALVHRRWALTAAHCLPQGGRSWRKELLVVVGLHNWRDREPGTQRFPIRAACPHPGYDNETMENDLLLLQLDGKVTPSKTRKVISLARKEPAPGARCSLAGWGVWRGRELSPTLQELEVTVVDKRMCNNSRFWNGGIGPAMICFQGLRRGSAPAKGDSGGPLVCGKRPAVAGVMSFISRDPTDPFKPPVAISTVKYKKWIQKTLQRGCAPSYLHRLAFNWEYCPESGKRTSLVHRYSDGERSPAGLSVEKGEGGGLDPGGDAGPPATPALPYSTRQCCSCDFPPFLQSRPLVPPCRPLPGQGGSSGHRGVPTTPVHIPGDNLRIPKVLVSPWPYCVSPEPLTVSPQPPRCVPCTCAHSPVCVPVASRGTERDGGHKGHPIQSMM